MFSELSFLLGFLTVCLTTESPYLTLQRDITPFALERLDTRMILRICEVVAAQFYLSASESSDGLGQSGEIVVAQV